MMSSGKDNIKEYGGIHYDEAYKTIIYEDGGEKDLMDKYETLKNEVVKKFRDSELYPEFESLYEQFANWKSLYYTENTRFSEKQKRQLFILLMRCKNIIEENNK